jgi:predicted XRE-type DNA-binding protein
METNNMNRTMLATHLGVSKSFVSQLLSGNYNYSLSKLIENLSRLEYSEA